MTSCTTAPVGRRVALRFADDAVEAGTHVNLSAVRSDGRCLWVAGDETATVERLVASADGSAYGGHRTFPLADLHALPGERDDEVDVEGLARAGGHLWAVGSHSAKRKKIKNRNDDAKALTRLGTVLAEPARRVLARLEVVDDADGLPEPVPVGSASLGESVLFDLLAADPHLGPFCAIPGKDNGLDIEGIAVLGEPGAETVYLGLRGPVLRGWAVLLELRPRVSEPGRLVLDPVDGDRPYRLRVADLAGLGIRDLCPDGEDLLILAGPTMCLTGPTRVHRWREVAGCSAQVLRSSEVTTELELPHGDRIDNPEGLALLGSGELLVVYDSPAPARLPSPGTVLADVVALP